MARKILMVCLGNICRSPIAEAVMRDVLERNLLGNLWEVDSAATSSWHVGKPADSRAIKILNKYGLNYNGRSRKIVENDFREFDYIFGMDEVNIKHLKIMAPFKCRAKVMLLGDLNLDEKDRIIDDPYFVNFKSFYTKDLAPFERVFKQCSTACEQFVKLARLEGV